MSAHGFKSLFMAASVAGAALGCYLVSLNVASERAKLERVEGKIVLAQREIRLLQTEIGTRGRLAQLERWNAGFIRLSAPTADQFLEGGFQLATMVKPLPKPTIEAPIVLASAPTDQGVARQSGTSDLEEAKPVGSARPAAPSAQDMLHIASYERPERPAPKPNAPSTPLVKTPKSTAVKAVTANRTTGATADSLAPLPALKPAAKASAPRDASASASASSNSRVTGTPR